MAGYILSALIDALKEKLASKLFEEIKLVSDGPDALRSLSCTLETLHAMLKDAEEKPIQSNLGRDWLQRLKEVAYDAEDVLDKFATQVGKRKLKGQIATGKRWTSDSRPGIESSNLKVRYDLVHEIKQIRDNFDNIAKERPDFHPREIHSKKAPHAYKGQQQVGSYIDKSKFFGREDDVSNILRMLLSDEINVCPLVIPIVGMGGVGKTALVQRIYNDEMIKHQFKGRSWACVPRDFDVVSVMKEIIESGTRRVCLLSSIDSIQQDLQDFLKGKRFLFVLDNLWDVNTAVWQQFRDLCSLGAKGSAIIITTRNQRVAYMVGNVHAYHLRVLPLNVCCSLFMQWAFPMGDLNAYPYLLPIGEKIVAKCGGLALAAKALGSMLSSKRRSQDWEEVLISEIWNNDSEILPALELSYLYLPTNLKQCFAFCSIFSKGYCFKKENLGHLWTALGFISVEGSRRRLEEIGNDIFDELFHRSFFQYSHDEHTYKMHDLMHDLAKYVSRGECLRLDGTQKSDVPENVRHLRFTCSETEQHVMFEALHKYLALRTLLLGVDGKAYNDYSVKRSLSLLFEKLCCLRLLGLVHTGLTELPASIGLLQHLRYLDLSFSKISYLPKEITDLYNLQILKLDCCSSFGSFPKEMMKLINLHHLSFPVKRQNYEHFHTIGRIGNLTKLQVLSQYIVHKFDSPVSELANMRDLGGALVISNLHNVETSKEAEKANLKNKHHLKALEFTWKRDRQEMGNPEEALKGLQPHSNLKVLSILNYNSFCFPSWFGDQSFTNLTILNLKDCRLCKVMPPLGQLPALERLNIDGMPVLEHLESNFLGHCKSTKFPSLKYFNFWYAPKLVQWSGMKEGVMPQLREFSLQSCPSLSELPLLPSQLQDLVIMDCDNLSNIPSLPSLTCLKLSGNCEKVLISVSHFTSLTSLTISRFPKLPEQFLQPLHMLKKLEISYCDMVVSLLSEVGWQDLGSLKELLICGCPKLQKLLVPPVLETLTISECPEIMQLFMSSGNPTALQDLEIDRCPHLTMRYRKGSLYWHEICHIPNIWISEISSSEPSGSSLPCLTVVGDMTGFHV